MELQVSYGGCDPDHRSGSGLLHVFFHFRTHAEGCSFYLVSAILLLTRGSGRNMLYLLKALIRIKRNPKEGFPRN